MQQKKESDTLALMIIDILFFALTGICAGFLSGLLGIGGGIVTIPLLVLIFTRMDIAPSLIMHLAIGTSLASMTFNTFSASFSHYRKKAVLFPIIKPMAIGIVVGTSIGAMIAHFATSSFLKIFFGCFELLVGIRFLLPDRKLGKDTKLPSFWPLSTIALGVSTLSAMLGIGGGILNVPILSHFHVPIKKAIGTASALSFLISLFAALYFLLFGIHSAKLHDAVGYLYLPAFIAISLSSMLAAPLGAMLAHRLHTTILKKIFALALLIAGAVMILK